LWRNRSSLTRAVRRWKAPWVQRIALLFAGERVRRPWYGRRGLREVRRQARREARKRLASSAPPAGDVTSERHGVSGSIGLGQSFGARAIASGGAAPRRKPLRPLARDTLGWPRITNRGNAKTNAAPPAVRAPREGDLTRGGQGSNSSAVVLTNRFDCRSRRAARGPSSGTGEKPASRGGSSFETRERVEVNADRKLIARRQSRRMSGGLPHGGTRRWKAPRAAEAIVVDATAGKTVLACRGKRSAPADASTRQATGGVRERSVNFARGRERRGEGASRERGAAAFGHAGDVIFRSCGLDVHRARTWGRVASDGGPAWSRRPRGLRSSGIQRQRGFGRVALGYRAEPSAPRRDGTIDARMGPRKRRLGPRAREVERLGECSTIESVAEVGERYFAREISVRCASAGAEQRRGEPRGEPSARGVAGARRPILDEEGRGVVATRVSRGSEGRTNKIFPGVSRSIGTVENQSGGRRPGTGTPSHLNRAAVKLVLARRKRFVA
jgi:hypothetical protein